MPRQPQWLAILSAATAAILLMPTGSADAAENPRQRLITAYAPVVMLRAQEDPPCDTTEEQFLPTSVDAVLGNPAVELVRDGPSGLRQVKSAPTAADIAGLGDDYYLNLPGDPLDAGCTYAEDFAELERQGNAPAITYAHIARQEGEPGLVVQYWFFYYFNQFNDVHEGDWEGMQIAFEAETAAEALADGPDRIALFQHGGGERADWEEEKVQKDGTHPIVFPAAGSHATFFDNAVYIENGQGGSGLGCDNTDDPLRRVDPLPVTIPTDPAPGSTAQWLTYLGHWGEKEKGFNNGPQGPVTKRQWLEPFAWMDGVRETSPRLPGGSIAGPAVTNAFCGTVASISDLLNLEAKDRAQAIAVVVGLILLIVIPALLTRWGPVELEQLRRRRRFGQLIRAARQLYGRHWHTLVPIGLTAIPILGVVAGVEWLAAEVIGSDSFEITVGPSAFHVELTGSIRSFVNPLGFAVVSGAVIAFVRELERGQAYGFVPAYRAMLQRFWRLVLGQLLASLLVFLLALSVIGLPIAIWKYIEWQFVQQEILFEDRSLRQAFRASSRVVRGRWWRTVRVAGFLWLLSIVVGPILGFALVFTALSPLLINVFGALVFALFVPYVAIGRTLLYFDLLVTKEEEGARAPSRRRRWLSRFRPSPQPG